MAGDALAALRREAVARALFAPTTLKRAVARMGFVQADPIRAPARAEDLILRHRVTGYRAGDLHAGYHACALEEDYFYAHGFMTRDLWRRIHPRRLAAPTARQRAVLALMEGRGPVAPEDLDAHAGGRRVTNAWGGQSSEASQALEALLRRGLVRVAGRRRGKRLYEACARPEKDGTPTQRFDALVAAAVTALAPAPRASVAATVAPLTRALFTPAKARGSAREAVARLLAVGVLREVAVDGVAYLAPADDVEAAPADDDVRLLAPFDPLVWDRKRFEHLWGWAYRFEAYTPAAKRVRGYYALPLLWRDAVIGWANVSAKNGALDVETGFVDRAPRARAFTQALDAEVERLRAFLRLCETA